MKRVLSLLVLVALLCTALIGCKDPEPTAQAYKLGIGVAVENTTTNEAKAKSEVTAAAVILDKDGKIVACRIDTLAVDGFFAEGAVVTNKTYTSKMELGADYGMLGAQYGSTLAEWDAQAKAFETFVTGKTATEVTAINNDTVIAGCTIGTAAFVEAVADACKDAYAVSFESAVAPTLGVALNGGVADKSNDETVAAELTVDAAAVAMVEGKVVAATLDCATPKFTLDGEDVTVSFSKTKRELGDDYGMLGAQYGSTLAEWYTQAQAYANTAVGKTATEVAALATDGVAGCTIYAGTFKAALEKAAKAVR